MAKTDFTRDQTINIAVKMGKILLKSGAETYRVEDTISRCCLAHGYEVDPFVTPTVIILGNRQLYPRKQNWLPQHQFKPYQRNEQHVLQFCQVGYGIRRYLQMAGQKMAAARALR